MEGTSNNTIPAGDLQPNLYAVIIITLTLAMWAVALRFLARRLVKAGLWLDDWLSLMALVRRMRSTAYFSIDRDDNMVV
jgi:hypothetical protein